MIFIFIFSKRRREEEDERGLLDSKGNLIVRPIVGTGTSTPFNILDFIDENNVDVVKKVKAIMKPSKKAKDGEKPLSLTTTLQKPVVKRVSPILDVAYQFNSKCTIFVDSARNSVQ